MNGKKEASPANSSDWMRRAVELAWRSLGWTNPNPLVGSVIVRDGEMLGEGWHERFGESHAEINAIGDAERSGHDLTGAEMFVTLEPCFHQGKTPPCVDQILEKKFSKVFILFRDPNPLVSGKSIEKLKAHGIAVNENFAALRREFFDLYEDFSYFITTQKPFIALKMALDSNGFMAGPKGERVQISGADAMEYSHFLRQRYAAILIGVNTVLNDDPQLGVRYGEFPQGRRDPLRIIFDPHLRSPQKAQVFRDENFLIVTSSKEAEKAKEIWGNRIQALSLLSDGKFDLPEFQVKMAERNISSILVEGGVKTSRSFLDQKCVQKGYLFISSKSATKKGRRGMDFRNIPEFRNQEEKNFKTDRIFIGLFEF